MLRKFKNLLADSKNNLSKKEYISLCRELVMVFDMEADSMEADLKQKGEKEDTPKENNISSGLIITDAPLPYIEAALANSYGADGSYVDVNYNIGEADSEEDGSETTEVSN